MQEILSLDKSLFILINQKLANGFFDIIMPFITDLDNWKIPIALLWIFLIIRGGKRGRVAAILLIPVLALGDQIAAFVFKPWVGRIRPCHVLEQVRLLVNCGGKWSFPSNHATNMAGMAVIFGAIYRKHWGWFWAFAGVIGYSRIYVGVHYPGDVLFGFFLGGTIGLAVFVVYRNLALRFPAIDYLPEKKKSVNKKE